MKNTVRIQPNNGTIATPPQSQNGQTQAPRIELMPEEVINQALALIDFLESKVIANAGDEIFSPSCSFNAKKSAEIAGLICICSGVKDSLFALIPQV